MNKQPFYFALTQLKDLYDITMEDDEFENIGMTAWEKIGNKDTATYHFSGKVDDGTLDLPCNADIIEMITTGDEDFQMTDNVKSENYSRLEIETYIQSRKAPGNSLYSRGNIPEYSRVNNALTFYNKKIKSVRIIYKGVILDDDGLPYLSFKEADAIAAFCAYVYKNKKGMATNDQATIQIAQLLKQEWMRLCENARTHTLLDQNDINEILNVRSSWDRKRYNVSYKLFS